LPSLTKKYNAVDVYEHKTHLKLLSLVAAIGVVFIIFAWTHYSYEAYYENDGLVLEGMDDKVPVTTQQPPQKLPALPPPPSPDKIEIVEQKPIPPQEPTIEPKVVPTTGPNDGKVAPSSGATGNITPDIIIEPAPEPEPTGPEVFTIVEQMPRFPGCEQEAGNNQEKKACADQKLLAYIYKCIRYPSQAREIGIEGTVVVSFVVNTRGKIQDIEILRDPGGGLGKEAKRVVKKMNELPESWTPGKQRGQKVKVRYNLPVRFTLRG
jgi:protein TonB